MENAIIRHVKFSISTNWFCGKVDDGAAIAEAALALGFSELELGYNTTPDQVPGFRKMLDQIPVGSVHAFCPVPMSAPRGYPELYQLASFDEEGRKMASFQVRRNIEFAASIGADALVLHTGRVMCHGFLKSRDMKRRVKRGAKMVEILKRELETLAPVLEGNKVTLGLENLPYLEGFPAEWEIDSVVGDWVKPWFDTGHDRVRECMGWTDASKRPAAPIGMHINDVVDKSDDHFAPGMGKVDFAALKDMALAVKHIVFEPNPSVAEEDLKNGLNIIKDLWMK